MCRISEIIDKNIKVSKLYSMIEVLNHRGPDDSGYFINKSMKVGLRHK